MARLEDGVYDFEIIEMKPIPQLPVFAEDHRRQRVFTRVDSRYAGRQLDRPYHRTG